MNDMVSHPEMAKSDSFYFVEGISLSKGAGDLLLITGVLLGAGSLIMHNKATYTYVEDSKTAPKPSAAAPAAAAAAAPAHAQAHAPAPSSADAKHAPASKAGNAKANK